MKMRFLLLFGLLSIPLVGWSNNLINWNKGSVVDSHGKVLVGEVALQSIDLILFREDNQVSVFTPFQVKSFYYYDEGEHINRKFTALKLANHKTPLFYELVVWGEVQVVRLAKNRNLLKHKLGNAKDYNYLVRYNDSYTKLDNFKRDVYNELIEKSPRLHQIIHKQKLSPFYEPDIIEIVKLYNWLGNLPDDVTAMR